MKVYNTFEEIDQDLKILRLKTKIEKEELKFKVSEIKEDLSVVSMATNFVGALAKKAVVLKTFSSVIGMIRKKK